MASDPESWCSRDGDLRSQQRQEAESSSGSGESQVASVEWDEASKAWVELPASSAVAPPGTSAPGGLGDLPLFLQHVALMREMDDLKDKVGVRGNRPVDVFDGG